MMKKPYKIVLVRQASLFSWELFSPNGGWALARGGNWYVSPSNAKRAARNIVLAMCTQPIIIEAKP